MSHLLQKAAEQGNTDKIRQLLDKGDDIEWRHKGTGRTALVSAAIAGQRDAVDVLIQRGANVNHQCTAVGYSALAWASELGLTNIADLLIRRGANLDLPSPELKRTALMAAAQSGHIDVVRLLLDQGAKPNLADFSHDNAWSLATERGHALSKDDATLPDIFWQEADDLVARYCTQRKRVYRRLGFGWPPEYTPDDELLSVRPVASRVEVLVCDAPRENGMRYEHLFVVKQSNGEWRIDSVKKRMRGTEDWSNGIL
jgi:hypothetical protein